MRFDLRRADREPALYGDRAPKAGFKAAAVAAHYQFADLVALRCARFPKCCDIEQLTELVGSEIPLWCEPL